MNIYINDYVCCTWIKVRLKKAVHNLEARKVGLKSICVVSHNNKQLYHFVLWVCMFVISFHFSSPSQYLSNYRRYQGWNEHLKVGYDNRFKQKFTNKELNSILLKLYSYTVVIAFFVVAFASTVFWFFAPKENRTYVNNSSPYIKLGETTLCNCIIIRLLIFTSKNIHESCY